MNRYSKFCDQCGSLIAAGSDYPRKCLGGHSIYHNPTPIGVILVPVDSRFKRLGILIGRRNHDPAKGMFGLPGGFMDDTVEGETIMGCAVRELREETGLIVDEGDLIHHYEYPNPSRSQVLVFYRLKWSMDLDDVPRGECHVSPECDYLDVTWNPVELAFPSHTEAVRLWFENQSSYGPNFN